MPADSKPMTTPLHSAGPWEPIDITTPVKWHKFFGRRIGNTTLGLAAAFSTKAFFIGVEIIAGSSRGIAISLGPVWIGVAVLVPRAALAKDIA